MKKCILPLVLTALLLLSACTTSDASSLTAAASPQASDGSNNTSSQSQTATDEIITITFYTYNYAMQGHIDGVDRLIETFEADHPNIKIEIVDVGSTEIHARIQADLIAGDTPVDIIQIVFDSLDFAINNYGATPLEDIAPPDELAEHLAGYDYAVGNMVRIGETLYGLPYVFSTPILFYNATLFEQAGLDPDSPPSTWEELEQYALQIVNNTGAEGFSTGAFGGNDWLLQSLIRSNGGRILSDDRTTLHWGDAEAAETMQVFRNLVISGAMPNTGADTWGSLEYFMGGNLGMYLITDAMQPMFIESANALGFELRSAIMPSFGSRPTVPGNSGSALLITAQGTERQQAAWKFMRHVTSDFGYTIITPIMGYVPLRPAITQQGGILYEWVQENPLAQPNIAQLPYLSPWESFPGNNWFQIETLFLETATRAVFFDGDIAEIMRDGQAQAQALMP